MKLKDYMTAYIFPGQGSQAKGMGEKLFDEFPDLTKTADEILGYSITTLCLSDPHHQLNQTQYTQPALFVINALSYLNKIKTSSQKPDYVVGHSLGEFNALYAAQVFDFATGLKLVKKRGELMSQASQGGMTAIIGFKSQDVQKLLDDNDLKNVAIANYNSYAQVVISGAKNEIDQATILFEQAKAKMVIPLKVSGAFHSKLMQTAQNEFATFLQQVKFSVPTIPIIANFTAKPYKVNEIEKNLLLQLSHPVRFTESIEYLISQGIQEFEEIGPGNVLTGLVKRIQSGQ